MKKRTEVVDLFNDVYNQINEEYEKMDDLELGLNFGNLAALSWVLGSNYVDKYNEIYNRIYIIN